MHHFLSTVICLSASNSLACKHKPNALYKLIHSLHSGVSEIPSLIERTQEQKVGTNRVCTELMDIVIRVNNVALTLTHLSTVFDDQTMGIESGEWLFKSYITQLFEHHRHKS